MLTAPVYGKPPADHVPLAERCKQIMEATSDLCYRGLTPEHLEGVYCERLRWLALLDEAAENKRGFKSAREMLAWLRKEGEEPCRP